jgi:hypothetical protein
MERELRELFREKAGEAPLATFNAPTAAPQEVLHRGRRRQVGTVIGSAAIVLVLIVGSVTGLTRILGEGKEDRVGSGYEVFQRTAKIEAFTLGSPSDWFLVNEWPLSMQMAVGSGSASGECTAAPGVGSPVCTSSEPSPQFESLPHGLPMLQLSNMDLGLDTVACGDGLPSTAAVLYIAYDYDRDVSGGSSLPPYPLGPGMPSPAADGPCGPGSYEHFTVNGYPMFVWVGVGPDATVKDRGIVQTTFENMYADDAWEPTPSSQVTPTYVVAGGFRDQGEAWRLDLRPGEKGPELSLQGVDPSFVGLDARIRHDPLDPAIPIEFCCGWTDGTADTILVDVTFGFVRKDATGVELQVVEDGELTGQILPGTIVPLPPSLGSFGSDLFFIPDTGGLAGQVVPLGIDASAEPPPVAEPRGEELSLSGGFRGQTWIVRLTGSFAEGNACIHVTIASEASEPLCPAPGANPFAAEEPSADAWSIDQLHLLVTTMPPAVEHLRFESDDGADVRWETQCAWGPSGWTGPDRRVCVVLFPPQGSGVLQYLGADGAVLFEHGTGWGSSHPAELGGPPPVDPVHGGTYWAVYPWVGAAGDPAADAMVGHLFDQFGIQAVHGEVACDQGAAEALGPGAEFRVAVYFDTEVDALAFVDQLAISGGVPDAPIAQVTTYCLD